ncbi:hypothetical protein D3C80_1614240 [compost metagenome]
MAHSGRCGNRFYLHVFIRDRSVAHSAFCREKQRSGSGMRIVRGFGNFYSGSGDYRRIPLWNPGNFTIAAFNRCVAFGPCSGVQRLESLGIQSAFRIIHRNSDTAFSFDINVTPKYSRCFEF